MSDATSANDRVHAGQEGNAQVQATGGAGVTRRAKATGGAGVTRRAVVGGAAAALAGTAVGQQAQAAETLKSLFGAIVGSVSGQESATADGSLASATPAAASARPSLGAALAQAVDPQVAPAVPDYTVEPDLSNVLIGNFYLADELIPLLAANGFAVDARWGGMEFFEAYESNRYNVAPNFVTVDSLAHTYHLYFSYLMKGVEKTGLAPMLTQLSQTMLSRCIEQLGVLTETAWEPASRIACAFFGVGSALLDPAATMVPEVVLETVQSELALIQEAQGPELSPLTGINIDYSQFAPRGYYEGDSVLESYFRAMQWYGQVHFAQKDEDLDRAAALITLALTGEAKTSWDAIYAVTSFFAGASDDAGICEYAPLVEQAFGADATVESVAANDAGWQAFHALTSQVAPAQINSLPVIDAADAAEHEALGEQAQELGFRFMGQRYSLDADILQTLIYRSVGANGAGELRTLPNALDVPAAFGSDEALGILTELGATGYDGYTDQMDALRTDIAQAGGDLWSASLYANWLHMLEPLVDTHGAGWPMFMRTAQWARKDLQSFLGSYTELKHDTVLYTKQAMAEAGGGEFEADDRGYVEPQPVFFARLAALAQTTADGLAGFGLLNETDAYYLGILQSLASQLQNIATEELQNITPTDEEFELIRGIGAQLEEFWFQVSRDEAGTDLFMSSAFPAALVTDIATDSSGSVLQVATGKVSTMYVIVPVAGELRLASGPVFRFYQFTQPISERLTDQQWRWMLGIQADENGQYAQEKPAQTEGWTSGFQLDESAAL